MVARALLVYKKRKNSRSEGGEAQIDRYIDRFLEEKTHAG